MMLNGWSFSGPGGLRKSCEAVCATDSEWAGVERGGAGIGTAAGALASCRRLAIPAPDEGSLLQSPEDRLSPIAAAKKY